MIEQKQNKTGKSPGSKHVQHIISLENWNVKIVWKGLQMYVHDTLASCNQSCAKINYCNIKDGDIVRRNWPSSMRTPNGKTHIKGIKGKKKSISMPLKKKY